MEEINRETETTCWCKTVVNDRKDVEEISRREGLRSEKERYDLWNVERVC